jgi:aryl-alcohol dehydrogenase-like predicted oxidoreductase
MSEQKSRRDFIQSSALKTAAGLSLASASISSSGAAAPEPGPPDADQWRNKQPGMAYRRLGRTGLMISEVICGGDPIRTDNYKHVSLALDMGLNYLDMAPAYGDCEIAYGRLLRETGKRNQVFLQTKISSFVDLRNQLYNDVFKGLPAGKQTAIMERVDKLRSTNLAEQPGYYLTYFPGQHDQFAGSYLSAAMMPDYAHLVEGSQQFRRSISDSIEGSLKRVGTDHFDLMMCPHGANLADELDNPHIHEAFLDLKK